VVDDGLEHLSKKTRERAFVLARNAKSIGVPLGSVRFTPHFDYMSYYLSDSVNYLIIFCTPDGYLYELWSDSSGRIDVNYYGIKNIRHFLQLIKREGYQDVDILFDKKKPDNEADTETDLREWVEEDNPDDIE